MCVVQMMPCSFKGHTRPGPVFEKIQSVSFLCLSFSLENNGTGVPYLADKETARRNLLDALFLGRDTQLGPSLVVCDLILLFVFIFSDVTWPGIRYVARQSSS